MLNLNPLLKLNLTRLASSTQLQNYRYGLVIISTLGLSSCGLLGVGYNNFLCQEQDYKSKCVSASTFLQHDQAQQFTVAQQIANQPVNSNELSSQTKPIATEQLANNHSSTNQYPNKTSVNNSTNLSSANLSTNIPIADAMALAINGHNQALDNNNFLVRGYYAFPMLTYPQVIHNNYLVVWVAPIKLEGKVYAPTFFTIPYLH